MPSVHSRGLGEKGTDVAASVIDDYINRVEKDRSDFAWHLLAGTSLGVPALPVSIFAEVRFEDVNGESSPRVYSAYGGINLAIE